MPKTLHITLALLLAGTAVADEEFNYKVDRAALTAQDRAIQKLKKIALKFKGSYRQQILIKRLVDTEKTAAKLEFRIAHGKAQLRKTKLDLSLYHRRLRTVISHASELIDRFPNSKFLPSMYLVRAESNKELKQKTLAKKDLLFVSNTFPDTEWQIQANLSLGEFAVEDGDYRLAITYLEKLEQIPSDPRYPFALYQIGWAHFNLEEVPRAISYLKRQVDYYSKREEEKGKLTSADRALKNQSLRDLVSFYFSRLDKEDPKFPLTDAFNTISWWEPGPYLGKMLLHFAKLMLGRDRVGHLEKWAKIVVEQAPERAETLEIVTKLFGYAAEKQMAIRVARSVNLFAELKGELDEKLYTLDSYKDTLDTILDTAANLQGSAGKTRGKKQKQEATTLLVNVYQTYELLSQPKNPKLIQVKFNLAELQFQQENYTYAAERFRWLIENGGEKPPISPAGASLKAIICEYKILEMRKLLAANLKPTVPEGNEEPDFEALDDDAQTKWVESLYSHKERFGRDPKEFETFEFEGYRLLFADGQTRAAMEGMMEMVAAAPKASVALPAANLVLDSYLMAGGEKALEVVGRFKNMKGLGKENFDTRLTEVPAEVSYRLMESAYKEENYDKALKLGETHLSEFAKSSWTPHVLWIAARSAMEKKDNTRALGWLNQLLTRFPKSENRSLALLGRAGLLEEAYDFDGAAADYSVYFGLKSTKVDESKDFASRYFFNSWLARKAPPLNCGKFKSPKDLLKECEQTKALLSLGPNGRPVADAQAKARKGIKENRSLWAAVALRQQMRKISYWRRLSFTKSVVIGWGDQDPLIQFSLIPILNEDIPEAFKRNQKDLPRVAKLKSDTKALLKRINLIKKFEDTAGKVIEVPWSQVKVSVLGAVGETYGDFYSELVKLPAPKELSPDELKEYKTSINDVLTPFGEKRDTIRKQVKELADKSPVRADSVPGIPLKSGRNLASIKDNSQALLADLTQAGEAKLKMAKSLWALSVEANHWGRVGFFFRELKNRFELPEAELTAMRAIALFKAGALPEAIGELESAAKEMKPQRRRLANLALRSWYALSTQPEKGTKLAAEGRAGK